MWFDPRRWNPWQLPWQLTWRFNCWFSCWFGCQSSCQSSWWLSPLCSRLHSCLRSCLRSCYASIILRGPASLRQDKREWILFDWTGEIGRLIGEEALKRPASCLVGWWSEILTHLGGAWLVNEVGGSRRRTDSWSLPLEAHFLTGRTDCRSTGTLKRFRWRPRVRFQ